jgi:ParB/RepB/Spo0J family partition protein
MQTILLSVESLKPNDYNPNQLSTAEFAELVTEVRHLGKLPKPVIVRPHGDEYTIVDGEHGWRAACEVGLEKIPCEVMEVDNFEAMRQTYKRNQHGTHHPVLLGRMFRLMMEERGLSQRALAAEATVSEGTIRNALLYSDAADLRNGYAFEQLSIRQVRMYLFLPAPVRDIWLDAGADLKALDEALHVRIETDGKTETKHYELDWFQPIVDAGLAETLEATRKGFVPSVRRALQLLEWQQHMVTYFPGIDAYISPVSRLRLPVEVLDTHLPCTIEDGHVTFVVSPEQWEQILADCAQRARTPEECLAMIRASTRLALRKAGIALRDITDPRVAEGLEIVCGAPDFIQESPISLADKTYLTLATAHVPDEVLLQAKRDACDTLQARDGWLTGEQTLTQMDTATRLSLEKALPDIQARWATITAESALNDALSEALQEQSLTDHNALFADRDRLFATVMEQLQTGHYVLRQEAIEGRPASLVLEERLRVLPWPEFRMLAALILGHGLVGVGFWVEAMRAADATPVAALTSLWDHVDDDIRTAFLVEIGAMTPLQDSRRSPTTRVLEAIQHAPSKTITVAHIADLTHLDPRRVSTIIFQLKKQKRVKEVRKGEYSTQLKGDA